MHIPDFVSTLGLDQDVESRVSQSLRTVVEGNSQVYRSPFRNDLSAEEILEDFDNHFLPQLDTLTLELKELELSNRSKYSPRSIVKPWMDRKPSLDAYFGEDKYKAGITQQTGLGSRLRPLSIDRAMKLLKNDTTSALPYLRKKAIVKEKTLSNYKRLIDREDPCLLFTRAQEQEKTRNVWGYPMVETLREMRYFAPMLEYHKANSPWRSSLGGPSSVDERVTRLFAKRDGRKLISIDFSSYDAFVKRSLQAGSWNFVKSHFQERYHEEIDAISDRFLTIGIVTPDGIYSGEHGVPSGSTFTNEIDSDAQYLVASNILDPSEVGDITGDDGIYLVDDPDKLIQNFENAGLAVNYDKSHISDDYFIYLQNYFSEHYRVDGIIHGIYPIYRALMRIVFMERWVDFEAYGLSGVDYFSIRALSILENCAYHPLFKQLVAYVIDNDKYGLVASEKGIVKYVQMVEQSSGTQGILTNQRGDDIGGIRNFSSFKIISELSS